MNIRHYHPQAEPTDHQSLTVLVLSTSHCSCHDSTATLSHQVLIVTWPTVINRDVYYDVLDPDATSLAKYYDNMAKLLQPRCTNELGKL